jgi:glycosyltransferase involved in cell wall biosynthesis
MVFRSKFPKGMNQGVKVGFINLVFSEMGGVETWTKSLIPHIRHIIQVDGIVSINDPHKSIKDLGVDWGAGIEDAQSLVKKVDTLVLWGYTESELLFKYKRPKRVICVHHGDEKSVWSQLTINKQLLFCDEVVSVNSKVADRYYFTHIPNSVTTSRISDTFSPNSNTVLWGHRFTGEKRPELAIEIAKSMPDFKFIFCGDGPLRSEIVRDFPANCVYVGNSPDLVESIRQSSVFLSTTNEEGFGYSVLEAVCSGLPVISSNTGIALEIADKIVYNTDIENWNKSIRAISGKEAMFKNFALEKYNHGNFISSWSSLLRNK